MKLRKLIFFVVTALMLSSFQCLYAHNAAFPLPSDKINEYPFNMVGMVSSGDIGEGYFWSGSGTAISQKVVLSCAHVFFDNEKSLTWYPGPFEWNLRHSPSNTDFDLNSRSYRYFSDFAEATRRFQPNDPRKFSYEQFNRDVICLIFYEDVANGGNAGWWSDRITDNSDKMIVGYPNLNYSDSDPRNHRMHSTSLSGSPAIFKLSNYDDRLNNTRRVYGSKDLSAGPGMSGGPVFGLVNFSSGTDWGIVGVNVGGNIGEHATVIGIDNDVYDLIKEAESASGGSTLRDDHGDTRDTATTVELNRSISGNLETEGDIDYFRFAINTAGTITAYTAGSTDTLGTLKNNLGNFVTSDDDSGSGENFLITRELNPGTYYIAVSHFFNDETGNYSFRVDFTETIKLPDLVVDYVDVERKSVVAGEVIRVDFEGSNTGDEDSGEFAHGLYLSADEIITTEDTQLGDFGSISMSAGTSEPYYFEVTIPKDTTPGTYYIGYILDIGDIIRETNENNNTGSTQIEVVKPALDLILEGSGYIAGENIQHPNGNVFNQILLTGQFIKFKAKSQQITRVSFLDINGDIVQVEFSGEGTTSITLDPATYKPPALPLRYNQSVKYVTGTASIVVEGAAANTFLSIFTVGKVNAVNSALFPSGQVYDGIADIKLVEVINSTGFGGMQFANVRFSGTTGKVGIDARDVSIAIRLTVYDINASDRATPYLLFGEGSFTVPASNSGLRITGGDLYQTNGAKIVAISEAENLIFQNNVRSDGRTLPAQRMRGSFDFIDRVVQSFVPTSFNEKIYRFVITSFDTNEYDYAALSFNGDGRVTQTGPL